MNWFKNIRWPHWTAWLFGGLVLSLVPFIIWLVRILNNPDRWCGAGVQAGKAVAARFSPADCSSILVELIHALANALYGAVGIMAIVVVALTVINLKVRVRVHGPGDVGGEIAGNDQPDTPPQ